MKASVALFNGTAYGYLYNLQGDVITLVDGTGAKVVEYSYDAWGKPTGKTGTMAGTLGTVQPFRYRGYVFDEETGDYYLRSRYYRAEWGRFQNADAVALYNQYLYCDNLPTTKSDSSGYSPVCALVEFTDSSIRYDTPLVNQEGSDCWAFCQVIGYYAKKGMIPSNEEIYEEVSRLKRVTGLDEWPKLGQLEEMGFITIGQDRIESIYDVYRVLKEHGPFVAVYNNDLLGAHVVLVTGVNTKKDMVYTNNPLGYMGEQQFSEFLDAFVIEGLGEGIEGEAYFQLTTYYAGYYYLQDREW